MFTITPEPENKRIVVVAEGFWEADTARKYEVELTAALVAMRRVHDSFDMLVDLQNAAALSREASAHIQSAYEKQRKMGVRKFASITTIALLTMQVKRLSDRDQNFRFFANRDDALTWLAE